MKKLARSAFVTAAAAGLVFGGSSTAAADTGSAGYFGNPHCLLRSLLTYGTLSAGDAGAFLPGCAPF
ncbi:hypothetical protein [Rhodococcus sp. R1101]|uniref:hypothetical protein n=1 Tax=Rhodococcus sp. R1101 TaxID=1170698 RepID=UPI0002DB5639|nr:hypothetical protein [Rhodococcus sp. R1101]